METIRYFVWRRFRKCAWGIAGAVAVLLPGAQESRGGESVATVTIDMESRWQLDGTTTLDRTQYFNIHGPGSVPEDWVSVLVNELDVNFGRLQGRGIGPRVWERFVESGAPSFKEWAASTPRDPLKNAIYENHLERVSLIVTGVGEPDALVEAPDGIAGTKNAIFYYWDLDRMADYIVQTFRSQVLPRHRHRVRFFELSNEPEGWWAHDWERLADLYVAVGERFAEEFPEIKFGGPCMFAPYVFVKNFNPWRDGLRPFIDRTSAQVRYLAFHSYDFYQDAQKAALTDDSFLVSGGHDEARLDLLENYTFNQFGRVHPKFFSEVGGYDTEMINDPGGENDPALSKENEELQNWMMINSANRKTMGFMRRPGRVLKSVPFILLDTSAWNPDYYASMLRREEDGGFRMTTLRHFFDLWAGIEGERIYVEPDDHNVEAAGFVDGNKGWLVMDNLSLSPKSLELNLTEAGWDIRSMHRLTFDREAELVRWKEDEDYDLKNLVIGGHEKIRISFHRDGGLARQPRLIDERWVYGDRTLLPIKEDSPETFSFDTPGGRNIVRATLRVGFGRAHGLSRRPEVTFNGERLTLPEADWGGDQSKLAAYFGVVPISVHPELIEESNEVTIAFPDDGGDLSTVVLVVAGERGEILSD